jgi:hypothetical protein
MGGNVFTMPTGGIKSLGNVGADIVHDAGENDNNENIKSEIKELSAGNKNAIIEENKIQETSYEKQLEKKKENTVVVKKKKPKKIKFGSIDNENDENKTEEKKKYLKLIICLISKITIHKINLLFKKSQSKLLLKLIYLEILNQKKLQ